MAIGREIVHLQEKIEYTFSDINFLQTALTHSSYSNELKSQGMAYDSNERLEFLGDAVLEIVISEYLFENYKKHGEGALTKMRQYLVCEKTLARIASNINLGDYLNVGRGEENTGCRNRPKVLADALEALIAAVYLDSCDRKVCSRVILALFEGEIKESAVMQNGDYKTMLQQLVERDGNSILEYRVTDECGPEHDKTFTVVATVNNNIVGTGVSKSKKAAEMQAARIALELFGVL